MRVRPRGAREGESGRLARGWGVTAGGNSTDVLLERTAGSALAVQF